MMDHAPCCSNFHVLCFALVLRRLCLYKGAGGQKVGALVWFFDICKDRGAIIHCFSAIDYFLLDGELEKLKRRSSVLSLFMMR